MRVGCPKEIKNHEYRVGLTPGSAREYVAHGHEVLVETGAGAGIGADDNAYRAAGARIAATAEDVFAKSDMVVKVKEPQPGEWAQLREGQILYTYLHLAPDPDQTRGLIESGVTAIAYETVTDERGGLPLLAPMSEVAGRLAIQAGATALQKANGGRGVLLGGVPGVLPGKVAIIGGGVVGLNAAKMAVGLGADVTIIDRSIPRLRQLDDIFNGRVHTRYSTVEAIEEECFSADVDRRRGADPGCGGAKARQPRNAVGHEAGRGDGRRRHRPGRLLRDLQAHHPCRADLRGRRHRPLLRGQHAGRGAGHVGRMRSTTPRCITACSSPTAA
jgi:alanine dehydrogenase